MKNWIKILLTLFAVGLIAVVIFFKFVYNKPHKDYVKAKPAFTLQAEELFKAYQTDKSGSDTKYTGQVIEITGKMTKKEVTDSTVIAIFVFSEGMFGDEGIRCTMLPDFMAKIKDIADAAEVKIKGYCAGYNDTDVIFEKCSVVE